MLTYLQDWEKALTSAPHVVSRYDITEMIQKDSHGKKLSVFNTVDFTRTRQGLRIFLFLLHREENKDFLICDCFGLGGCDCVTYFQMYKAL